MNKVYEAQNPQQVLDGLLMLVFLAGLFYVVAWAVAARSRRSPSVGGARVPNRARGRTSTRPEPPFLLAWPARLPVYVIGFLSALSLPAVAQRRLPTAPFRQPRDAAAPPWSATSGFPPPRPLVRIRAPHDPATPVRAPVAPDERPPDTRGSPPSFADRSRVPVRASHPPDDARAIGSDPPLSDMARIFARAPGSQLDRDKGRSDDSPTPPYRLHGRPRSGEPPDRARRRAMDDHPAGRARSPRCAPGAGHHLVVAGDTLWDIAGNFLGTEDGSRIARFWPRIHRVNLETIGADPSLIFPGSLLVLPDVCAR